MSNDHLPPLPHGVIDAETLTRLVDTGRVDTVVMAFPDLQGRLMGKRLTGRHFLEHVLGADSPGAVEVCNYLLAVDVDMTPLPGFAFANWDRGYGDMVCRPDLSTLRVVPWLEATALVLCDVFDEQTGAPVEVAPRRILQRQVERAAALGLTVMGGSELEFFLFRDSYEEAEATGFTGLTYHSAVNLDYHVFQTTRDEYLIRQIRNGMDTAGIEVEFSKGEASLGQHEINLRYTDVLGMADRHVIYKNGAKEIAAANGRALTFMAKYDMAQCGSSCHVHSSVWSADGRSLMWSDDDPDHLSPTFRGWLGGLLAHARELTWCFAPTVNSYKRFQPGSWAPTGIAWGRDNRTCGFRVVGHGAGARVECRIPGADANPYLAFAATIAAGLDGIERGLDPGPAFVGNAYESTTVPRVPWNLVEATEAFAASTLASTAFGADVHEHLVNVARQEWAAFASVVTDWERRRNFVQF